MIVIRTSPWHATFRQVLDLLESDKMKGCCDEVWLGVYGYYPLSEQVERAKYIKETVAELKEHGIRPVMEFGSNFGHVPEAPETEVTKDFEKMVGLNGKAATGSFCPRGKNFLAYEKELARLFAQSNPWGMYIDDDLRLEFRNIVGFGCFCDHCIGEFNKKYGYDFTREEIGRRFVYDTDVRAKYVKHNREAMHDYAYMMAKEMAKVNPGINAGWENCFLGAHNGEDFRYVFDGLHEAVGGEIMSRSGAFVYNDHNPRSILDKVLNTSCQNSILPDFVTVRRPEIENTDFFAMGKSIHGTCSEATLNMALGCNGVSFHSVGAGIEPLTYRERMWKTFGEFSPYWKKLKALNEGTGVSGMSPAYFPDVYLAVHKTKDDLAKDAAACGKKLSEYTVSSNDTLWWTAPPKERGRELFGIGMPVSYETDKCGAYILPTEMIERFSDSDIKKLLASNVLTDGNAIMKLEELGYGDYLPLSAKRASGLYFEVYTDDMINGDLAGKIGMTDQFVPVSFQEIILKDSAKCRILSKRSVYPELGVTEFTAQPEQIISAACETSLGGKWGVIGSNMWCILINSDKRLAMLRLCDYLAGGLPAYITESEQVAVIPRTDKDGRFVCATLQSISIGDTAEMTLIVRKPAGMKFVLLRPGEEDLTLESETSGDDVLVKIPSLRGWHSATVAIVK